MCLTDEEALEKEKEMLEKEQKMLKQQMAEDEMYMGAIPAELGSINIAPLG